MTQNFARLAFGLALVLGISSCSKLLKELNDRVVKVQSWEKADVSISCPSGDCPDGVGMVVFIEKLTDGLELSRCTATLIEPNSIITNSHCGKDLNKIDESYFFVVVNGATHSYPLGRKTYDQRDFPESEGKRVAFGEDLAIYRLAEKVPLEARAISRKIPEDMNELVMFAINESSGSKQSVTQMTLKREVCSVKDHSGNESGALDRGFALALFNCSVIAGNSGGPLFLMRDSTQIQVVVNSSAKNVELGFGNRVHCMKLPGFSDPEELCHNALEQQDTATTTDAPEFFHDITIQ